MSIAKYAMSNKRVIHFFLILTFFGGIIAFEKLGKLEDAPFVIKEAILTTHYPGATQHEVEELVTEVIEREMQTHWGIDWIKSESRPGVSIIKVAMLQSISKDVFDQIWDELRRKVLNAEIQLPVGAGPIAVNDDFGDVFGIYYGITSEEGFAYSELEDYAEFLRRELVTVQDVKKIDLYGVQPKVIDIELSQEKLVNAGIRPSQIVKAINSQNKLVRTGKLETGEGEIRIEAKGTFQSVAELEDLVISGQGGHQFRLKDIATVTKGYVDPPVTKMRMNGKVAIGLGISTRLGGNSVVMGENVAQKLEILKKQLPIGIEIEGIYFQDKAAVEANNEFIVNLVISVAIVVFLILLAMGVRAGILIGTGLLFSILGTLLIMLILGVDLHRTSLAAIIVAMGMLVDNAIVVTDNAQMAMKQGVGKVKALIDAATKPQWGLLGATFIAVMSFLPLYLAPSNTAEIIKPLFIVLAVALTLSWIFALVQTTVYGEFILKEPKEGENKDPYDTKFYKKLQAIIEGAVKKRWLTLGMVVLMFAGSVFLFGYVKQSFFPAINKAMFKVDYFLPQTNSLAKVEKDILEIEEYLFAKEEVKNVSITLGTTPLRYYLASIAWTSRPNLAHFLIETDDYESANLLMAEMKEHLEESYPDAVPIFYKFKVSPAPDAVIEPTFNGPDPAVLRDLAEQAKAIMLQDPLEENVRDSWGEKRMVWKPRYSQNKGQIAGVSREDMANSLKRLTDGQAVGEYREGDDVFPILLKDADRKHYDYGNLGSLPIFNNRSKAVPLDQVVEGYDLEWENVNIRRYNRQRSIAAQSDPIWGIENPEVEAWLIPQVEAIPLPEGYSLWWDGMYEEQMLAQEAIASQLPMTVIMILLVLVVLFNSFRKPLMIFLMIPLVMIGIVLAFLASGTSFGFFAILGVLGLIGMVIKNAIVLLDQANLEMDENNKSEYDAIILAARNRAIPVGMAAGTTIMGMIPLLPDPMFGGMAATIMGGLFVASILTIFVFPVLYAVFYNLKPGKVPPS